ncbi:16S rRNA methyltransferase [Rhodobacter veldkampii DSM 11550]|uniref:16S rRNA methyltransferase n=1 Tax=Phaeovulum veldkampii DSM 11550 TaxID=1185920 RepID=A0A2T4JLT2_9RHOB|nr:transcription antitermination factor NusB [Phaeovulum veldkampii]MBK5946649.1 16S rRNA methyltransferase [Phaeovulum veldkampii DSM 11550]PTE18869.1 16S rRNA methyltransferase [Phaeovulum veldkampii DSM 11550]TDQ59984.1 16S rRNA (cytosine967-C5)-methyltransferase [Phaeovulum veldkampii DSM 11550]
MSSADAVRGAALGLIAGVTGAHQALSDQLATGALVALAPADRARAQRLALTTLRQIARADAVLKPHLRRAPPADVQALLRLATVEMLDLGAAPHGVVGAAVALARAGGQRAEAFAGLVNAVLRKVAATDPARWSSLPPPSLPDWLRGRLMSAWGKRAVMAMEAAHLAGAPLDLTPKDGDAAALAARLGGVALATGSVRLVAAGQVSDLPGYAEGDWWVQDAAAALPARILAPGPGARVLDLCAAPGGKTLQLAATGAQVTALDISGPRMARVTENLARCGLAADCVVADALTWQPPAPFHAVLLDAPCSATGTIRRHPDLPFVRTPASLRDLFALQARLIDRALAFLAPGGRLVFATCSLLPDEGEAQVTAALARHPGLRPDPEALALPGLAPEWTSAEGGLRLRPDYWPEVGGMDGFYIAALRHSPA